MAKHSIPADATSESVEVFIQDTSKTDGSGLTGLAYNTSGLTAYYSRTRGAATAITLATLASATASYSSGGFKEIDATNMPGLYRLDIPDACLAGGVRAVVILLKGAANMAPVALEIDLIGGVDFLPVDAFKPEWNTTDSPGEVTVFKPDGTTVAYTRPIATDAAADPITGSEN